jgi:hypothetical protein
MQDDADGKTMLCRRISSDQMMVFTQRSRFRHPRSLKHPNIVDYVCSFTGITFPFLRMKFFMILYVGRSSEKVEQYVSEINFSVQNRWLFNFLTATCNVLKGLNNP